MIIMAGCMTAGKQAGRYGTGAGGEKSQREHDP